jgi:hypothetical protein
METQIDDILFQVKTSQNGRAYKTAKIEGITSFNEESDDVFTYLKTEGIFSRLEAVVTGEKVISDDIIKLNDSLDKINLGIRKLQSSVSRLAEKTSKRLKIIRIIQIVTLLSLLLYIAFGLYQKLQDLIS